ncbi:MAG: DNA repair protein RadC [Gammaproteobacteria bacterium]|jgi:DNA repair protein RadC
MPISDWPEAERPREKLLSLGPAALSDAELLAIFLRTGAPGQTAVELARGLIRQFGSLRALFRADAKHFCATRGLGTAKYVQLQAALELTRRHLRERLAQGAGISNPGDTERYLQAQLRDYPYEVFACLFLNTRHRVIAYEELFRGTIDGASVHPREVMRRALEHNAAAVILAHNHPSGIAEPSAADQRLTRRLSEALGLIDVRVLDHFVIGDRAAVSFAERGLL